VPKAASIRVRGVPSTRISVDQKSSSSWNIKGTDKIDKVTKRLSPAYIGTALANNVAASIEFKTGMHVVQICEFR
jgi:hypothetical protein